MYSLAAVAARTEEILQQHGWNKGYLTLQQHGKSTHCVGGALNLAMFNDDHWRTYAPEETAVYRELATVIQENPEWAMRVVPDAYSVGSHADVRTIARWNNHIDTTREDISAALSALAAKELVSVG